MKNNISIYSANLDKEKTQKLRFALLTKGSSLSKEVGKLVERLIEEYGIK